MLHWYLIHTKPAGEALAQANLERQGYRTYLPQLERSVLRHGLRRAHIGPLFPRYLFMQLAAGQQSLSPVRSSVGVSDVVRFGNQYTIVPDAVVRELYERADPHSGLHRLTDAPPLQRGASVQIVTGLFQGLNGVFERAAGTDRVIVLLNILGQDAPVRVPADFIVSSRAA